MNFALLIWIVFIFFESLCFIFGCAAQLSGSLFIEPKFLAVEAGVATTGLPRRTLHLVFLNPHERDPLALQSPSPSPNRLHFLEPVNDLSLDGDLPLLTVPGHPWEPLLWWIIPKDNPSHVSDPALSLFFFLPLAASVHQLSWQQSQLIRHFGVALGNLGWNLSGPVLGRLNQDHLLSVFDSWKMMKCELFLPPQIYATQPQSSSQNLESFCL